MVKIIWNDLALEDLKSVRDFTAKDSVFYANRFIEKIIKRVDQLGNFPRSGRIVPEFGIDSIRELIEGNYRIVYKIFDDHIVIVRIHHAARFLNPF